LQFEKGRGVLQNIK